MRFAEGECSLCNFQLYSEMGPEPLPCVCVPLCWLHAPRAAPGAAVKERGKRDPLRAQVSNEVLAVSLFFFLAGRHNKKNWQAHTFYY